MKNYRYKHPLELLTAVAVAAVVALPAIGQNIDYQNLEVIFQEPITLAANGTPQRASEVAATVDIITAADIKKSGAQTIPAALRRLAGVDFTQFSSTQQEVAMRGYNGPFTPRTMVLLNGRPVYVGIFGFVAWEQLPVTLTEIRQIEVVRGPTTAMFGLNASAGAINIVTYNPLYDDNNSVQARLSSEGDLRLSASLNYKLADNLGLRFSAQHNSIQVFEQTFAAIDGEFADSETSTLFGELIYTIDGATTLGVEGSYTSGEFNSVTPNFITSRSSPETWSVRARGVHVLDFGEIWLDGYLNSADYNLGGNSTGSLADNLSEPRVNGDLKEELLAVQAGITVSEFDSLTIRAVGEYRQNEVLQKLELITPSTTESFKFDIYSISGLMDWDATDFLNISATVRYDQQNIDAKQIIPRGISLPVGNITDLSFDGVSTNFSASFKLDAEKTLRLSAARGVRVPSPAEIGLFAQEPLIGLVLVGNPRLRPSRVDQVEASFEWRKPAADKKFRLTAFLQDNNNITSLFGALPTPIETNLGTFPVFQSQNVADSTAFGFELEYEQRLTQHLTGGFNYSFIDLDDSFLPIPAPFGSNPANGDVINYPVRNEDQAVRHRVNAWLDYSYDRFSANLTASYFSARQALNSFSFGQPFMLQDVSDQLVLDTRLAYLITETITVELVGNGLGQQRQFISGREFPGVERRVWLGLRLDF